MFRRLIGASIWAPGAIPSSEGEAARDVKRFVFPAIDVFLIIGSWMGLNGGLPTFAIVYNEWISHVASVAVLLFAIACMVGIAFPRLWAVELSGKCGLAVVLITYSIMLLALAQGHSPARGFVAGVAAALCVVLTWRIIWLSREQRRRVARRRALAALAALRG